MKPAFLLLATLSCCGLAPAASADQPVLHYETLLGQMASMHPAYRAAQAEGEAARHAIDAASALPDPEFRIELMEIDGVDLRPDAVGTTKYTIEQRLPLWGKRGLQRDAARATYDAARVGADLALAGLRAELRTAFAAYHAAAAELAIIDKTQALLGQALASAGERNAAGIGAQQDVIRARTEQGALALEAEQLRARSERARIALLALTGQPFDTALAPPGPLPPVDGFEERCTALLEDDGLPAPALAVISHELERRKAESTLAARERYPDLAIGVTPVQTGGRLDTWELMLGMRVPLHGGTRARMRETRSLAQATESRYQAARLELQTLVAGTRADFHAARANERIITARLLPEAQLGYRSALAGYRNGQVDFDTVVAAARQVHDTRRQQISAAVLQQTAVAEFERLTGAAP